MFPIDSRSRILTVALAAMGVAVTFHALHALFDVGGSSLDGFTKDGVYTAIEFVAVGVCGARVLRRGEDRVAWALICVGLLVWTAGDLVWTVWLNDVANPPYPSIADVFYLADVSRDLLRAGAADALALPPRRRRRLAGRRSSSA